jgi:hypothetical protein
VKLEKANVGFDIGNLVPKVSCNLRFASGATGAFACLSATPYYGRLTAFSQDGWLEARESGNVDRGLPSELVVCDKQGECATRTFAAAPTVRANLKSWAAAVLDEAPNRFNPAENFG